MNPIHDELVRIEALFRTDALDEATWRSLGAALHNLSVAMYESGPQNRPDYMEWLHGITPDQTPRWQWIDRIWNLVTPQLRGSLGRLRRSNNPTLATLTLDEVAYELAQPSGGRFAGVPFIGRQRLAELRQVVAAVRAA
jgi:hypothetical protein